MAKPTQRLRDSKKAIALGIALININAFIFLGVPFLHLPNEIIIQGISAVLFLVGIYVGVQGGIDMVQSNRFDYSKRELKSEELRKEEVTIKHYNVKEDDYSTEFIPEDYDSR
jgi:hypothetical protein